MNHLRQSLIVAGWEFRRYFKWKDQVISLVIFLGISAVWYGVARLASNDDMTFTVALSEIEIEAPPESRLRFVPAPDTDSVRVEQLRSGELDGILGQRPDGTFELLVQNDPRYQGDLQALLTNILRQERLAATGLSTNDLAAINAPAPLAVAYTDPTRQEVGGSEKIVAGAVIGLMILAVITSMAYLMTGITGEKQLRVTESVVSAISPQAWIDGKVIGITGYALTGIGNLAVGATIVGIAAQLATDFTLPLSAVRPGVMLLVAVIAVLGMVLWNCFFAAIAATIDDPNTSTRSSLMMLPVIPVAMAFFVFRSPDSALSHFLAVFPLTSAPALPARLVLSDPGIVEVAVSIALLIGAIWLIRRIAGRIFEVGMLLYGKEPGWGEITRWALRRSDT